MMDDMDDGDSMSGTKQSGDQSTGSRSTGSSERTGSKSDRSTGSSERTGSKSDRSTGSDADDSKSTQMEEGNGIMKCYVHAHTSLKRVLLYGAGKSSVCGHFNHFLDCLSGVELHPLKQAFARTSIMKLRKMLLGYCPEREGMYKFAQTKDQYFFIWGIFTGPNLKKTKNFDMYRHGNIIIIPKFFSFIFLELKVFVVIKIIK